MRTLVPICVMADSVSIMVNGSVIVKIALHFQTIVTYRVVAICWFRDGLLFNHKITAPQLAGAGSCACMYRRVPLLAPPSILFAPANTKRLPSGL